MIFFHWNPTHLRICKCCTSFKWVGYWLIRNNAVSCSMRLAYVFLQALCIGIIINCCLHWKGWPFLSRVPARILIESFDLWELIRKACYLRHFVRFCPWKYKLITLLCQELVVTASQRSVSLRPLRPLPLWLQALRCGPVGSCQMMLVVHCCSRVRFLSSVLPPTDSCLLEAVAGSSWVRERRD